MTKKMKSRTGTKRLTQERNFKLNLSKFSAQISSVKHKIQWINTFCYSLQMQLCFTYNFRNYLKKVPFSWKLNTRKEDLQPIAKNYRLQTNYSYLGTQSPSKYSCKLTIIIIVC